jgi:hypothetical protein
MTKVTDVGPQLRSELKAKAQSIITTQYQLVVSQRRSKIESAEKQREFTKARVEELLKDGTFIYGPPTDKVRQISAYSSISDDHFFQYKRGIPFAHPAFKELILAQWFKNSDSDGIVNATLFNPIPLITIAFTATAVSSFAPPGLHLLIDARDLKL